MISFSAVFVEVADVSPNSSAFYRVLLGSGFLLLICVYKRCAVRPFSRILPMACLCGFLFALDLLFWHISIRSIGPGLATIISNFQVFILAAFGAVFLKERLSPAYLYAVPLAILGLVLIVGLKQEGLDLQYRQGILFGILTAICYAGFLLCFRRTQSSSHQSELFILLTVSIFASVFLGLKMIYSQDSFLIPNLQSGFALLGLGLLCQTVGWLFITHGLPKIRTSLVGLILLIQPTLSFIWDVLLFQRPTEIVNWAGVIITLTAIYLGLRGREQSS